MKGPPAGKERETEMTAKEEKELQEDRELLGILRKHLKVEMGTFNVSFDQDCFCRTIVAFTATDCPDEYDDYGFWDFGDMDGKCCFEFEDPGQLEEDISDFERIEKWLGERNQHADSLRVGSCQSAKPLAES